MNEFQSKRARDLLRLDDLEGANDIAEAGIERVADQGNDSELWRLRFVRAEVMRLRGKPEQALKYLESQPALNHPNDHDIESRCGICMHRGYHLGLMARFEPAHRLLAESEA